MAVTSQYRYMPNWWKRFSKSCPLMTKLFFSEKHEYKLLKGCFGFLYGLVLGVLFYKLVILALEIGPTVSYSLGVISAILIAIGCAVSSQIRCTSLLTFPTFGSKSGRSTLRALVIAYILAGPVANLTKNATEVIRTFTCTTSLTYNLTRNKYILMYKPFQTALMNLKADTSEIQDTLQSVKEIIGPIKHELEDDEELGELKEENDYIDQTKNDTKRSEEIEKKYEQNATNITGEYYEKKYFKKLEYRCGNIISGAESNCVNLFDKTYDDCTNNVPWGTAWILCWPMKLTFICDIITSLGGDNVCDPSKSLSTGFGDGYIYLLQSEEALSSQFDVGHVQYKIVKPQLQLDLRGASDTVQAVYREFQVRKSFLENVTILIKRILVFVFIRILFNAQDFQENYLKDLDFQNVYITKYFKKIDARRYKNGLHALLPLKKMEKKKLLNPYRCTLHSSEMTLLVAHTLKLTLEMMTAATILLIDRVFYETLLLVRENAKIQYEQTGHHQLVITVKGTGMIASIIRSILSGFNFHNVIENVYGNERCLPNPTLLSYGIIRNMLEIYILVFLLTAFEGYSYRAKWFICSYFYPKHEKKRVLHLYNATLKARIGFFKYMQVKVQKMIKEHKLSQDMSITLMLRLRYPKLFRCISWYTDSRRKCLICGELEPKSKTKFLKEFHECQGCLYIYCNECWADIDEICYVCNPPPQEIVELQEMHVIEEGPQLVE